MIDLSSARARRHFYLARGLKKRPVGSGSDLDYLMGLPRKDLRVRPDTIFLKTPVLVVGGVATRAYMPERQTDDIDFLVMPDAFANAVKELREAGFAKTQNLVFPNATLGLFGEAWTRDAAEVDLLSSPQPWCEEAFGEHVTDQTGLRVIGLPYLVLMKFDSARTIDQGDLSRMLGRLDDGHIESLIAIVARHLTDPNVREDIRQYVELGRWERQKPEKKH